MGTDTKGTHYNGGGTLEVGDHRLFEDGCECGRALNSDVVETKTASEGWSEDGVRAAVCQGALTRKQTLQGGGALQRGDRAPLEPLAQLGDALRGVGAAAVPIKAAELVVAQAAKGRRSVSGR